MFSAYLQPLLLLFLYLTTLFLLFPQHLYMLRQTHPYIRLNLSFSAALIAFFNSSNFFFARLHFQINGSFLQFSQSVVHLFLCRLLIFKNFLRFIICRLKSIPCRRSILFFFYLRISLRNLHNSEAQSYPLYPDSVLQSVR